VSVYHNFPTDFISSQQWLQVNFQTLTKVLSFWHKTTKDKKGDTKRRKNEKSREWE
jgi:hypothetical protein